MTLAKRRLPLLLGLELVELEGVRKVDARQVRAELVLESGPEIRHRDDEVRPMGEVLQLADELATEDGLELATRRQPSDGWGVGRHGCSAHLASLQLARASRHCLLRWARLTITLDVFIPLER